MTGDSWLLRKRLQLTLAEHQVLAEAQAGRMPVEHLQELLAVAGSIRVVVRHLGRFVRTPVDHKLREDHSQDLVGYLAEAVHQEVLVGEQVLAVLVVVGRMDLAEGTLLAGDLDPEDLVVRSVARRHSFEEVDGCSSCREGSLVLVVIVGTVDLAGKGPVMVVQVVVEVRPGVVDTTGFDFEAVVDRTADTGQFVDHIEHWEDKHLVEVAVHSSYPVDHILAEEGGHTDHWDRVEGNFLHSNLMPDRRSEAVVLEHPEEHSVLADLEVDRLEWPGTGDMEH